MQPSHFNRLSLLISPTAFFRFADPRSSERNRPFPTRCGPGNVISAEWIDPLRVPRQRNFPPAPRITESFINSIDDFDRHVPAANDGAIKRGSRSWPSEGATLRNLEWQHLSTKPIYCDGRVLGCLSSMRVGVSLSPPERECGAFPLIG